MPTDHPDIPKSPEKDTPDLLGFTRKPMEGWYNPTQLALTALRSIVSSLFGTYADKREMQACLEKSEVHRESADQEEIWVDYVADLGSGFNSTYTLAYLLGKEALTLDGKETQRGNLLIMGGDQVYPTPNGDQYNNRMVGPYRAAKSYTADSPTLFAIPGNHDWYDGLTSFLKLFCQKRWIGGWKTAQTRSYFAIQLPHRWWIWGIDIQLCEDIDQPQLQFFEKVNREHTQPGDRVILCTAEPAWVYKAYKRNQKPFQNLEWFCQNYITRPENTGPEKPPLNKLELPLTLTGDLHQYNSYCRTDGAYPEWKITAGGGGAFMHPTHQLPTTLVEEALGQDNQTEKKTYQSGTFFPSQGESRKLALGNLLFAFRNLKFAGLMGTLYLLFAWMLASANGRQVALALGDAIGQKESAFNQLSGTTPAWAALEEVGKSYAEVVFYNAPLLVMLSSLVLGLALFSDRSRKNYRWAATAGVIHGLVQVVALLSMVWWWAWWGHQLGMTAQANLWARLGMLLVKFCTLFLTGGLASATLMGIYLLLTTLLLKIHETEAFSALRGQDYKNFLRLHLTKNELTIYPVGIPRVPRRWDFQPEVTDGQPWYEPAKGENLKFDLIEKPIVITFSTEAHKKPSGTEVSENQTALTPNYQSTS